MLNNQAKTKILELWENYLKEDKKTKNLKGEIFEQIDIDRLSAIEDLKQIIQSFISGDSDVYNFKTSIDSYNKKNNLWGFTAIKGQMFFNQLVNQYENNIDFISNLLKSSIVEPENLEKALEVISNLEKELDKTYINAPDKRKVAKPSSIGYFLSYFWQIYDHTKWPVLFSSQISAYEEIGIWEYKENQRESYQLFYELNDEIKKFLSDKTKSKITNWDVEHCFWDLHLKHVDKDLQKIRKKSEERIIPKKELEKEIDVITKAKFDINDYLIPKVANLVELGDDESKSSSEKGSLYEKMVADIFKLLEFEVEYLGQGKGRNPDAILRFSQERIAFIVDAKAYSKGYNLGIDDRAIREYINFYTPKLIREGYNKIGFIIVSNSFKSKFETFINDVTWNTDIKRFILLTSNALLHLLAYKTKDNLSINQVIESIIELGTLITEVEIIEAFEDV